MRKICIGIGIFLGCLFLIAFIAIQTFQTGYVQRMIQKKINAAIPGQLTWQHLRLSLIRGEIELAQISLLGSSGNKIADLDRLWIDLRWLPIFSREIVIENFYAKQPQLDLCIETDGKLNLVRAFSDSTAKEKQPEKPPEFKGNILPFNIVLQSARLRNGTFSFTRYDGQTDFDFHNIQITGAGDLLREKASVKITTANNHLKINDIESGIDYFSLSADYQKNQVERLDITLRTPETSATLAGSGTHLFQNPQVNLNLDAKGALSEIKTILHLKPELSGLAVIDLKVAGTLKNPEANLRLTYKDGVLFSRPIEKIQMKLDLKDRIADFNDLSIYAASGESHLKGIVNLQSVFPEGFLTSVPDFNQLSYDLHLMQNNINLNALSEAFHTVSGDMSSKIHISGKGARPESLSAHMNLEVLAKNLSTEEFALIPPVRIAGDATFHQYALTLNQLRLISENARFSASGMADLSKNVMTATVDFDSSDIHPLATLWGLDNTHGGLSLNSHLDGPFNAPQANIKLTASRLLSGDIALGDLEIFAELNRNGVLEFSRMYLKNQNGALNGQGKIEIFRNATFLGRSMPLILTMDFEQIDPRSFYKSSPVAGELNGQLAIDGAINQPRASLKLDGKSVRIQTLALGDISSFLRYSEGSLYIDRADLQLKNSGLKIAGDVQLLDKVSLKPVKDPFFRAEIKGNQIFLQDVMDNTNVQGMLSLKAKVKGHSQDIRGNINVKGRDIILYEQPIESLLLNADLSGDRIQIKPLDVFLGGKEALHLTGQAALDKTYEFALSADEVDLKKIQWIKEKAEFTDGKLFIRMMGEGSLDNPRIDGDIKLSRIQISQKSAEDIFLNISLENQVVRISGDLHCDIEGIYHLADKRFSVLAQFPNTDLSPYFMLMDQPDLSGHLSGKIDLSGKADNFHTYEGALDISNLEMLYQKESLIQGRELHVLLKDREITTRDFTLTFPNKGRLNIDSRIKADETVSLILDGKIPLSVINIFQKDFPEITGDLYLNADVQGAMSSPRMHAEIGVRNLKTQLPFLYQTLHKTDATIRVTPQAIQISSIKGQLDSGSFEMTGQIDLDQRRPVSASAQIKIHRLPISVPDTLDLMFSSDIRLQGKPEKSIIEGDLMLLEGLYYRDVNLLPLSSIGQKKRKSTAPPQPIQLPFLKRVELNMNVKHRQPMFVDNNIARMDIVPELKLKGTLNHPIVNGRMTVQSGEVMYQKKTFVIKKGIIDFINPYETEPTIDIQAEHQIRDWMIGLKMKGTPNQLEFELTSEPHLADEDIVSLLILGRTSSELRSGEGGSNQSAGQMLAQFMATAFEKDVKNVTGLDIFQAEAVAGKSSEGSNGIKVTLGKELTNRIILKYSVQNEKDKIIQQAIAEYKLLEEVLLSIFQGDDGAYGGSAKYRLEFR